jgi:hypothetical protein
MPQPPMLTQQQCQQQQLSTSGRKLAACTRLPLLHQQANLQQLHLCLLQQTKGCQQQAKAATQCRLTY